MRVPLGWLSEFLDLKGFSAKGLAESLTMKSAETTVEKFGPRLEGTLTGVIKEVKNHIKDEDLAVLKVNCGVREFTLVSKDRSLKEGEAVLVAPEGAKIGTQKVSSREIKGVLSQGILISLQDLGLEDRSEGVLRLGKDVVPGEDGAKVLGIGEEILELDLTPNRGDLLSVRGVARELSAILRIDTKEPPIETFNGKEEVEIIISDDDCRRYRGAIIESINNGEAPLFIRKRLWQCGLRSINLIVDITNYVMLQEGQPLHAFDLKKLSLPIEVRSSAEGERIRTLDGVERYLPAGILVIADGSGPVAVAGVMGGEESAVSEKTDSILLESAHFNPRRVRRSSSLLNLRTESSYRFERNVDIEGVAKAQDLAIDLIIKHGGGNLTALTDVYRQRYQKKKVFLSWGKLKRYSSTNLSREEVSSILSLLDFEPSIKDCGVEVLIPSHREFDISRDVDVIEEIMRVKGYDHFKSSAPSLPVKVGVSENTAEAVKDLLRAKGLHEVINIPFDERDLYDILGADLPSLEVLNPLIPSQRFLRSSLIPGLIKTALFNDSHYNYDQAFFEIGSVFTSQGEELRLGVLAKGVKRSFPQEEWTSKDLKDILLSVASLFKRDLELETGGPEFLHPGSRVTLLIGGEKVGFAGTLSPEVSQKLDLRGKVAVAEVSLPKLIDGRRPRFKKMSKYPPAHRDLALIVDKNMSVSKLLNEIRSHIGELMEEVRVFDLYAGEKVGEGKKSVGIRIALRSELKSLSGEEVQELMENLVKKLRDRLGARLR